ncbi:MAG: transposase, partial [Gammaproteobacteria bacterium]|nr:transposase [Gammaproteobacteria bacterium]
MRGDLTIRTVRTSSGATAVQIIRYERGKRLVVKHIGSAHTDAELLHLKQKAEIWRERLCVQPSLFGPDVPSAIVDMEHLQLSTVTHRFAYETLKRC